VSAISQEVFVPAKPEQALYHGGAFVFKGDDTLLTHYDEFYGAPASLEQVLSVALQTASE